MGSQILERTDTEKRVSVLTVEKANDTETNTIEILWRFDNAIEGVTQCVLRCHYLKGHKQRHHREGH